MHYVGLRKTLRLASNAGESPHDSNAHSAGPRGIAAIRVRRWRRSGLTLFEVQLGLSIRQASLRVSKSRQAVARLKGLMPRSWEIIDRRSCSPPTKGPIDLASSLASSETSSSSPAPAESSLVEESESLQARLERSDSCAKDIRPFQAMTMTFSTSDGSMRAPWDLSSVANSEGLSIISHRPRHKRGRSLEVMLRKCSTRAGLQKAFNRLPHPRGRRIAPIPRGPAQ